MSMQEAKYQQVFDWIKENIESGAFRPGERLASETELSARFGLSRQTIRHATGELASQGYLTRIKGSGTYISTALPQKEEKDRGTRPRTMNIAVVSTLYGSYIFPETIKGIERVLSASGYAMQVSFTDNRLHREREILKAILEKDAIDGLIVEPAKSALPNPNLAYYRKIRDRQIPILFFNASYPDFDAPCVRIDDTGIARKATDLLIRSGHRRIGAIFKSDDSQGPLRYKGYLEAMDEAGCRTSQEQIIWIDTPETTSLEELGDYLLRRLEGCTAVMCYNDQVAYQVIEIAGKRGVKVPEKLSVVGIDDAYLASMSRTPLTSFPHPKEGLGRKAAENLLRLIEEPGFDANYLFDSDPVCRESVAEIRAGGRTGSEQTGSLTAKGS